MLHIVNKSHTQTTSLQSCLRLAKAGQALLLTEDAVYAATSAAAASSGIAAAMAIAEERTLQHGPLELLMTLDEEANLAEWNEDIGKVLAQSENVDMTPAHWEVVNFLREYYNEYQIAPAVRVLTKAIGKQLGAEKGNSKYLYDLFPYGPAKQACKIAGLPKPTGCI